MAHDGGWVMAKRATRSAATSRPKQRKPSTTEYKRSVRPDPIDFRDLIYRPSISVIPTLRLIPPPPLRLPVKNQRATSACTGFALSLVVEYLLRRSGRDERAQVSPFMLYSMARRYDEFPGSKEDNGSSLRGALKGWHKHGACASSLWPKLTMPPVPKQAAEDWWPDALGRPLGAYYRIEPKQIADIHSALNEVGIVYASADTHAGWDAGLARHGSPGRDDALAGEIFRIEPRKGANEGHAFAIVGYTEDGFLIQNSWGKGWGTHGYAILSYQDWFENAMDCWVTQLGVVTREAEKIRETNTLRVAGSRVALASTASLRQHEIAAFIVNMENNGRLSDSGHFRTQETDLRAIVEVHVETARERWKQRGKPLDICIYAHGGLVGEDAAAESASTWIPALYDAQIFPIYLMWETDLRSTLVNMLEDALSGPPRPVGGARDVLASMERWWNRRLERLLAEPGTKIWGEMKENARLIGERRDSGVALLWNEFARASRRLGPIRVHLVGHSAGSIVHGYIVKLLTARKVPITSVSFLAPAITVADFERLVRPRLESGAIRRYLQVHLTEDAEEADPTCGPYRRSLLHLVSESFEGGKSTPILGLLKDFKSLQGALPRTTAIAAPGAQSRSATHGGFDDDRVTRERVIAFIHGS